MRLKQLKLAGFKSFVDPAVIPFPSQLVSVVGPNGCGKSNIIDAVRWVMGESSAKHLRGESMADVIFNGSSNRKPVGQALVELVFDNTAGRLTGQYAAYQEIAIKRVVTRDGDSSYYLNGTRCRRRDINDIFLGTGAGARGYAIIGQDMIARLIEARPEELRAYLEEAAGVSKYKERRRETLTRIKHTKDNLERVNDIRDELAKQLARLERQAKTAERYKRLKAEERQTKAEILAIKWRQLDEKEQPLQTSIKSNRIEFEAQQSKLATLQNEFTHQQQAHHESSAALQATQEKAYQLGNEIARLEEMLQQKRIEKQRMVKEREEALTELSASQSQLDEDKQSLEASRQQYSVFDEQYRLVQDEYQQQLQTVNEHVKVAKHSQEAWAQFQRDKSTSQHGAEKLVMQVEHLESRRQEILSRIDKLKSEQGGVNLEHIEDGIDQLREQAKAEKAKHDDADDQYQKMLEEIKSLRIHIAEKEKAWREAQAQEQKTITHYAALKAAQDAAVQANFSGLANNKWQQHPRLVESIHVENGWQKAFEMVLGESLQGVLLGSMDELKEEWATLDNQSMIFLTKQATDTEKDVYPRLLDKMKGAIPNWFINVGGVFAAGSLEEALSWLPTISSSQSIVTQDGIWLGQGWAKVTQSQSEDESSLLARQEQLKVLDKEKALAVKSALELKLACEALYEQLQFLIEESDQRKASLSSLFETYQQVKTEVLQKEQRLEDNKKRALGLDVELEALQDNLEKIIEDGECAKTQLEALQQLIKQFENDEPDRLQTKEKDDLTLTKEQSKLEALRDKQQATQLKHDREKLNVEQLSERIKREEERLSRLQSRYDGLDAKLKDIMQPEDEAYKPLEEKNNQFIELQDMISQQREAVETIQQKINDIQLHEKQETLNLKSIEEAFQAFQLEHQAVQVRTEGLLESLQALSLDHHQLLDNIDESISLEDREEALRLAEDKINRLGAINLVAIEEYDSELQRKQHLDEQHDDLCQALDTLEDAIAKMDKETQQRLQATYDEVNASFQALFPRLFGGGRANLERTCDNLLEAGIVVIAQPPGKRNSTISMLSGGEKAMTAIALVFAIFQLNPAPFCMLDEVDAPLDDANVKRFSDMVAEMSQYVQFLFITHNKITMELAEQLIGVTMREPGVSRIVAVDVEEALNYSKQATETEV